MERDYIPSKSEFEREKEADEERKIFQILKGLGFKPTVYREDLKKVTNFQDISFDEDDDAVGGKGE